MRLIRLSKATLQPPFAGSQGWDACSSVLSPHFRLRREPATALDGTVRRLLSDNAKGSRAEYLHVTEGRAV